MPTKYTDTGAVFSSCGLYRYNLWRYWGPGPSCVWAMLNPSKAGADTDDPTIRRCVGFSKLWGCGGIQVVNMYPLVSTDPKVMLRNPCRDNLDPWDSLRSVVRSQMNVVCAWGNHVEPDVAAAFVDWAEAEIGWQNVTCLGITKSGQPKHPLRLAYAVERVPLAIAQGRRAASSPEMTP